MQQQEDVPPERLVHVDSHVLDLAPLLEGHRLVQVGIVGITRRQWLELGHRRCDVLSRSTPGSLGSAW